MAEPGRRALADRAGLIIARQQGQSTSPLHGRGSGHGRKSGSLGQAPDGCAGPAPHLLLWLHKTLLPLRAYRPASDHGGLMTVDLKCLTPTLCGADGLRSLACVRSRSSGGLPPGWVNLRS